MLPVGWLRPFDGEWAREVPLAPATTWRIGGPAELLLEPRTVDHAAAMVRGMWRAGLPYRVLGGGSNLLVADTGVRGAVVTLRCLRRLAVHEHGVDAEAGAALHVLVRAAASAGLAGAECLAGIPGHVGGAVFGNAGGRHGAIGPLVRWIDVLERDGTLVRVEPGDGFFAYRRSAVGDRIVLRARLALTPDDAAAVRARSRAIIQERRRSQPGWVGNAGCVFKNPAGHSAGGLIDATGLKGLREGGIAVSSIHANFFENDGGGTADDVRRLADRVADAVERAHGVRLEMEVRRWE